MGMKKFSGSDISACEREVHKADDEAQHWIEIRAWLWRLRHPEGGLCLQDAYVATVLRHGEFMLQQHSADRGRK